MSCGQKAGRERWIPRSAALPVVDSDVRDQVGALLEKQARAQQRHFAKQLQQAAKKARGFLIQKLIRKGREAAGTLGSADSERVRLLKALPPAVVARAAQGKLGIELGEDRKPDAVADAQEE